MARAMLVVPMSIIVSEATFSAGGRVIEPHRSYLKMETIKLLLCRADGTSTIWFKKSMSCTYIFTLIPLPLNFEFLFK